ncbi:MAG: efflux transporter periplasmic adaptor subunit [Hydrogenophilales bacterium 16-64-46]|nr:MAG: efflux transporter periplasmic adaptor subunit [Hydrogenophilales bacterium 12-64-13]OYZ05952.1 MAG: efflux transporter periplasmic adaptor subunit [Hydrogenophilales bacterium 16-64-46]OZA39888.1 MAG: efflux transporter periplasmic adaptor subunit [Hydrogenophilales bacterium 17-64-34]HQT00312.1 efflux RND transporter periplasmic adaptor subunit [Thiobacillus sp.]
MKRCLLAGLLLAVFIMPPARAADGVELTTRVSGVVDTVLVNLGQQVKKGTVLLRLDDAVLRARVDEASAGLVRAEADAAEAKRDFDRAQELYTRTVSSTSELDLATTRQARAQADVSVAKARLDIARKNLADAELKAPFDARVSAIPGLPGTVVAADCQPRPLVVLVPQR